MPQPHDHNTGASPSATIEVDATVGPDSFRFVGVGPCTNELRGAFRDWLAAVTGQEAALDALADTIDQNTADLATARDASTVPPEA